MDHIDWLDAPAAKQVAQALGMQVVPGGRLILRSAALCPPYVRFIQEAGFEVRFACLGFRVQDSGFRVCLKPRSELTL